MWRATNLAVRWSGLPIWKCRCRRRDQRRILRGWRRKFFQVQNLPSELKKLISQTYPNQGFSWALQAASSVARMQSYPSTFERRIFFANLHKNSDPTGASWMPACGKDEESYGQALCSVLWARKPHEIIIYQFGLRVIFFLFRRTMETFQRSRSQFSLLLSMKLVQPGRMRWSEFKLQCFN